MRIQQLTHRLNRIEASHPQAGCERRVRISFVDAGGTVVEELRIEGGTMRWIKEGLDERREE